MTFSHTVSTSVEDHIVMARVTGSNNFRAHSRWFAVNVSSTTNTETGGGIIPSPTGSSVSVSQSSASTATSKYVTATVVPTKSAPRVGAIVGGVLGSLAFLSVSGLILSMLCRRQTSRSPFLFRVFWKGLHENRHPITPFPLEPNLSAGGDNLRADMSRIREEILTLQLENQTRRVEDRYRTLPPPSYTSSPSEPSSNI
ncbi:hypothetical protein IW261DRAFT_527175 [Armillaria novae-zelandiae]|uniref:Uncharacterized protein n=1 Tax=Armillaria novae-zelandiae TaxID=153914 RepID=A0AA39NZY8_9AGAR|nr:hypothetical protein IW261DRAFT_527175 [Armillaria novae-zelandiae]